MPQHNTFIHVWKLALASTAIVFSGVQAQSRVVVIPLGDDDVQKEQLVFPRITAQCLQGDFVTLRGLESDITSSTDRFIIDDRDKASPVLIPESSESDLPVSTSRISVFVQSSSGQSMGTLFASLFSFDGNQQGSQAFGSDNNCLDETTTEVFFNSGIPQGTMILESITGRTWELTSNVSVENGSITLGPTLFSLSQP